MSGIIELLIVIALAAGGGWLTWRLWRLGARGVRLVACVACGLVTGLLALIAVIGLAGVYRLYVPRSGPTPNISAGATPDQLIVATRRASGCRGCHGSNGSPILDGGTANMLGGGLGVLVAPNLTPGGPLKEWSDGEIVRAIREGVDRNGRALLIMPSEAFHSLSDEDVSILVAYLRAQPAMSHMAPDRDLNLLGLMVVGAGQFPTAVQPPIDRSQTAPAAAVSPEYGRYLVDISGCRACHGQDLQGRAPGGFGPPAGPSLRTLVAQWPEGDFVRFFRTGLDPTGRAIDPSLMPWQDIGSAYTDDELRAMYQFLSQPSG